MKKVLILCGIAATFLCLTQTANAQYLPDRIHRDGADFVDGRGRTLSDADLIEAVGADVFEETVIGARKQYRAGRTLLISGIAGLGAGVTGLLVGAGLVAAAEPRQSSNGDVYFQDEDMAIAGGGVVLLASVVTALGGTALSAGIPLKVIGQSRLNWVENSYNERQAASFHLGATPNGVGLAVRF